MRPFATLAEKLKKERPGGYDPDCCTGGTAPTPDPAGWCNPDCVDAETLAGMARSYGLNIESGDNWTREKVHQKLIAGHPVLALVRVDLGTTDDRASDYYGFGHFVVIRGLVNNGKTVIFNDSYPNQRRRTLRMSTEQRRAIGEAREEKWVDFDNSWASGIDSAKHVRWAMAVVE